MLLQLIYIGIHSAGEYNNDEKHAARVKRQKKEMNRKQNVDLQ